MINCMQFHNYLNYLLLTIIKPLVVSDGFRFVLWLKEHKCFVFFDFTIIKKNVNTSGSIDSAFLQIFARLKALFGFP